jgi:hypothetical protein
MLRITTGKGIEIDLVELLIRWPRPLKQTVSVAAIGTSRLGGIFGGPLPGPATLDLGFGEKTRKVQIATMPASSPTLSNVAGRNCRDDVRADKQLKSSRMPRPMSER